MSETTKDVMTETPCDYCMDRASRNAMVLCEKCAPKFRVIFLPSEQRVWADIARDGEGDDGVDTHELVNGLMVRMFNQQRELSKLNRQISELKQTPQRWGARLGNALEFHPEDVREKGHEAVIDEATKTIRRYRWLRRENYVREDLLACGGEQLDKLCDEGVREYCGVNT